MGDIDHIINTCINMLIRSADRMLLNEAKYLDV